MAYLFSCCYKGNSSPALDSDDAPQRQKLGHIGAMFTSKRILYFAGIAAILLGSSFVYSWALPQTQLPEPQFPGPNKQTEAIKEAFQHSWDGYKQYAWGADELLPLSKKPSFSRNGWGATIVDALSTAILMDKTDIVLEALQFISTIDFTKASSEVSVFETTIRYMGGLLSAYDLLTGPYESTIPKDKKYLVENCLKHAATLGNLLKPAFKTPSGLPGNYINIETGQIRGDIRQSDLAEAGTLVLEWTKLSDLTGDPSFAKLTQKAEEYMLKPKPASGEPFPGLLGTYLDIKTGNIVDTSGGWNGGDDSFYEYLLKMYIYDPKRFAFYGERWLVAAGSTLKYLKSHPSNRPDITFVQGYNSATSFYKTFSHLGCFMAGNILLGGEVFNRTDLKKFGGDIAAGCHHTYASTSTKIGPELFTWEPLPAGASDKQRASFIKNGFWIPSNGQSYILRPEVVESYYYGYRITGDAKYRKWAWEAFTAINASARNAVAYSVLNNVDPPSGTKPDEIQEDTMESFWYAETLKYLFLTLGGGRLNEVNVRKGQQAWVFNTEAHPVKVAANTSLGL